MAITSCGKSRGRSKTRAGTMKRKSPIKRRNAPAAALADPRYRERVVKSAKAYRRKGRVQVTEDEDA